jgi:hypothetical protein
MVANISRQCSGLIFMGQNVQEEFRNKLPCDAAAAAVYPR